MKLEKLRLATQEEVDKIASTSDITATSKVLAQGPSTAVWRLCNEVDPVYFGEASNQQKVLFINNIQHFLLGAGANEFYFNVPVSDEHYQQIVEHFGASRTSKEPEYRYKILL